MEPALVPDAWRPLADDLARRVDEPDKRQGRTAFQRDRARVLHSSALRRLAAKTQVHVAFEDDFPRTRLTHSLECAQIGREMASALGTDPDLVEAACLAHDLGHPPFGHNGEAALDEAAASIGGFEGNAQSLRILTRLEIKVLSEEATASAGLNLTRATLDATVKYPWTRRTGRRKFGAYDDDAGTLAWIRDGRSDDRQCFEAQIMDWADDVAYSVHDLEDALHADSLPLAALHDASERAQLLTLCLERYAVGHPLAADALEQALDRLLALPAWPKEFHGSIADHARAKELTSTLIGRFTTAAEGATRAAFPSGALARYAADLVVPLEVRAECAVLKAVTARYVMERPGTEKRYTDERALVAELLDAVVRRPEDALGPVHQQWFDHAGSDAARLRVAVDLVASLTDPSAVALHRRLLGAR
jgi:dGTPase